MPFNYRDKLEIGRVLPKAALRSSLGELIEIHSSNKIDDVEINAEIRQIILEKALGTFILLPELTQHDIDDVIAALRVRVRALMVSLGGNVRLSLIAPMPDFRIAQNKTPVGLYYAVYGSFPDLAQVNHLSNQEKEEIIAKWKANPELPLTYTTSDEDVALANRLREMTGRRFSVATDAQNEYSIRGRELVGGKPTGRITTSTYYFGDDRQQLSKHGWFVTTSGLTD